VKLLLERRDVNPNLCENWRGTPLSEEAKSGHEGIVKLLLERGEVNPDLPGENNKTPLWEAAGNGHEGVVKLLLQRKEVNPDSSTGHGQSSVVPEPARAAKKPPRGSSLESSRLVAPPGSKGSSPLGSCTRLGQTPLSWAVWNGHEGIVKLLLECKEVNSNSSDEGGRTPLFEAAWNGNEGIVKLLLGRKEVNPNLASVLNGAVRPS